MIAARRPMPLPPWVRPAGDPTAAPEAPPAPGVVSAEDAPQTPVPAPPQPVVPTAAEGQLRPLAVDADGRPSRVVLVRAIHQSTGLPRVIPSFDAIVAALRALNFTGTASVGWIGPYPRIVRRSIPGGFETHVAWLHQLDPNAATHADSQIAFGQRRLAADARNALVGITGPTSDAQWSGVSLDPYSEANHGPRAWWVSGYAARTRTRDREPAITDVDMQENPIGPDAADLQNPDYLSWVAGQVGGTATGFSWGLVAGGAAAFLGALYLVAKVGGGSREVVVRAEGVGRPRVR